MEQSVYEIDYHCGETSCGHRFTVRVFSEDITMHGYSHCVKCNIRCQAALILVYV